MSQLHYIPFNSLVNPSFWHKLTQIKLDIDKLDETERTIWASLNYNDATIQQVFIEVDSTSFNDNYDTQSFSLPFHGKILNKNTIEQFKECDKNTLMQQQADEYLKVLKGEEILKDPSLLNTFFVLSFADLKKYQYYYWFAFPAPLELKIPIIETKSILDIFSEDQIGKLYNSYLKLSVSDKTLFIVKTSGDIVTISDLNSLEDISYIAFTDANHMKNAHSAILKNILTFLTQNPHFKKLIGKTVTFLALRVGRNEKIKLANSEIFKVQLPETCGDSGWIGWERNERGNMGPKMSNMKNAMDPKVLSETSVDLNLKLMKWRLLPQIDLERIKAMKCLLLGAGTLGCSVARVLLGWGVRNITFVDNSTVSHSNPVRQSLFKFDDAVKARPKAQAAATNLREIFPGVEAVGHNINVLMPGHPIGESLMQQAKDNFNELNKLIDNADVVFLLMDSRESRWLPTVLSQVHNKIVINAALGFDTYLVMRHGVPSSTNSSKQNFKTIEGFEMIRGDQLGCYFCNDVTAPGNSLKDRTLDKQCTVTRPGVSQIAGALAVELAVSLMQHPQSALAPAYYKKHNKNTDSTSTSAFDTELEDCLLGLLPHSIRGFLSNYTQVLPATQKYDQCIACSEHVLNKYKADGFDFLLDVFQSSQVLEDLTGLTEIHNMQADDWDFDEPEDAFDNDD